jgi:hypothetical protein
MRLAAAVLVLASAAGMAVGEHFTVSAAYVAPAKPKAAASIAVTFIPADPDVKVNQEPAPRLKLDPEQVVLIDRQPPPVRRSETGGEPKYLDSSLPVSFPVTLNPHAPKGEQAVKGNVTYFYCSKREGWCRKGTAEVAFVVNVP